MQTIMLNIILKFQVIFLGVASWLDGMFEDIAKSNLNAIFDTNDYAAPAKGLFLAIGDKNVYAETPLWTEVSRLVNTTINPIGVALVTTYFIMSLIDMASKDNTTLEHYIREFIKLIVAVTVVSQSWVIILYLMQISESLLSQIKAITPPNPLPYVDQILEDHENGGYIGIWFTSLLPWLIKKLSVVALYVCVFMRALDCAWRAALMPIGAANLFEGGISSPGVKYIKSFFGSLLAGAMIMLILTISPPLLSAAYDLATGESNAVGNYGFGMLGMTGAQLAIVGAAFGASSKVREVFS